MVGERGRVGVGEGGGGGGGGEVHGEWIDEIDDSKLRINDANFMLSSLPHHFQQSVRIYDLSTTSPRVSLRYTSAALPPPSSLTILSASPTCRLTLTSLLPPFSLERIIAIMVNPWDRCSPLMTFSCYCSGSEDDERRFRCR